MIVPKTEIPDMGFYAISFNTENNMFGLGEAQRK
jgi:predicted enzyme related to lactoylglutathione lyase